MFLKYSKGEELINVLISPTHCVPLNYMLELIQEVTKNRFQQLKSQT